MAIDAGGEAPARGANHCRWRFHGVVRRQCEQRHRWWCVARLRRIRPACCPPASWARQLGISDCDVHDSVLSVTVFERLPMRGKKGTTSVKHDVKQYVRRVSHVLKGADEGAGTISGVALIAIVAAMLGAVAMAGNLLLCVHRAQNPRPTWRRWPPRSRCVTVPPTRARPHRVNVGQWNPARILCH